MLPVVPILKVKKLFPEATTPTKAHTTDSGYDLYAYRFSRLFSSATGDSGVELFETAKTLDLPPLGRVLIATGIAATVGEGLLIVD